MQFLHRYGENVIEANQNPNWICPVCREICNCSLCRQAKGWPPTGSLYRKVNHFVCCMVEINVFCSFFPFMISSLHPNLLLYLTFLLRLHV